MTQKFTYLFASEVVAMGLQDDTFTTEKQLAVISSRLKRYQVQTETDRTPFHVLCIELDVHVIYSEQNTMSCRQDYE